MSQTQSFHILVLYELKLTSDRIAGFTDEGYNDT